MRLRIVRVAVVMAQLALAALPTHAGLYPPEDIRATCRNEEGCMQRRAKSILEKSIGDGEIRTNQCETMGTYRFQKIEDVYPREICEQDAGVFLRDREAARQAAIDAQDRALRDESQRKVEQERQAEQREIQLAADLRSGKVKPANFRQVAIAYAAESGTDLASAPKVRPDGKLYALQGKIEKATQKPEFIAHASRGQEGDAVAAALRWKSQETRYYMVLVPRQL